MEKSRSHFLSCKATDINEPSVLACQKKINESPETRVRCIEVLRRELKNIKDIDPCLDDSFLLQFLRVSKFDTQKALKRVQTFYQQYDVLLDAFKKCSLSIHKAQTFNHLFISPYRMKNSSILLIARHKPVDYRWCTFAERLYLDVLTIHETMENPVTQICGTTLLFDFEGFDFHAFLAFTPGWMRIFLNFFLNAAPSRLKEIHIVNAPPIFLCAFNAIYPFIPKKIQDRLSIHSRNGGWQNLHSSIPVDILPMQYGGKLSDDKLISCLKNIKEMDKKFLKSFAFGSIRNQQKRKCMKIIC